MISRNFFTSGEEMKFILTILIAFSFSCLSAEQVNGYSLECPSCKSEASFYLDEIARFRNHSTDDFSCIIYRIVPNGFPTDTILDLRVIRPAFIDFKSFCLILDSEGNLLSENSDFFEKPDRAPFYLIFWNPIPGERIDVSLSVFGAYGCSIHKSFIPYPLDMEDSKGHKVSLELLGFEKGLFYCRGEGFNPREKIKIEIGGKNSMIFLETADSDGKFFYTFPELFNNAREHWPIIFELTSENAHFKNCIPMSLARKQLWVTFQDYLEEDDLDQISGIKNFNGYEYIDFSYENDSLNQEEY